jgi:hypothetical protein
MREGAKARRHEGISLSILSLVRAFVPSRFLIVSMSLVFCTLYNIHAQYLPSNMTLNQGEEVRYDIYFKWGILMPRAGEALVTFNESDLNGQPASLYRLLFNTVGIIESVYKMRDTLDCYYDTDNRLLYSSKRINEGGFYLIDELTFTYAGETTSVHSFRYTPASTRIDTNLILSSGHVFDMLGATFFLRTLDRKNLKPGDSFPFIVAIGRDLIQASYRYQNQAIIERDNVKYRTHYYIIDIYDDAFSQSKAAAELWVGDDENQIPIKIRTKPKVGYAEVHYKSSNNLKNPLDCRVEMKK